jgi:hypothetical protein
MRKKLTKTRRKSSTPQRLIIKQVLPEEMEFWKDFDLKVKKYKKICFICQIVFGKLLVSGKMCLLITD